MRHGVDIVRDYQKIIGGSEGKNFGVRPGAQTHVTRRANSTAGSRRKTPSMMCSFRSWSARKRGRLMAPPKHQPFAGPGAVLPRRSAVVHFCSASAAKQRLDVA